MAITDSDGTVVENGDHTTDPYEDLEPRLPSQIMKVTSLVKTIETKNRIVVVAGANLSSFSPPLTNALPAFPNTQSKIPGTL